MLHLQAGKWFLQLFSCSRNWTGKLDLFYYKKNQLCSVSVA